MTPKQKRELARRLKSKQSTVAIEWNYSHKGLDKEHAEQVANENVAELCEYIDEVSQLPDSHGGVCVIEGVYFMAMTRKGAKIAGLNPSPLTKYYIMPCPADSPMLAKWGVGAAV